MTREELAALNDQELDERVATTLMGWRPARSPQWVAVTAASSAHPEREARVWYPPAAAQAHEREWQWRPPRYTQALGLAWQVVQRIMQMPASVAEAKVAPNTRFGYAFEWFATAPGVKTLWALSEQEAARWICIEALLAWHSGPLFPEESEGGGGAH